jgi:hypothetical protein
VNPTPESRDRNRTHHQYVYWFEETDVSRVKETIPTLGLRLKLARMTPCEVLKSAADTVFIASPEVFNRVCSRQGSWYRRSHRYGQFLLVSAQRLPAEFDRFLDAEIVESDFRPDSLPTEEEIRDLIDSPAYQENKPSDWELIGRKDAFKMKFLFTLLGTWKKGDNLKKYWPTQCAVHANFLDHQFTTDIDGESVPYSVSNSAGICSSCVETFNLIGQHSRKLVASCPGAVKFGGTKKDVFLDVKPVAGGISQNQR